MHAARHLEFHANVQDRNEIDSCLKGIFISLTREEVLNLSTPFENEWSSRYTRPIYHMEKNFSILLKYDYPEPIRKFIYCTNLMERSNKEIRRRTKVIDSLPSEKRAVKIIYLGLWK